MSEGPRNLHTKDQKVWGSNLCGCALCYLQIELNLLINLRYRSKVPSTLALNLGCGSTFINSKNWTNVDFVPAGSAVLKHDLLQPLPFLDKTFDLVYTSHFVEHIPLEKVSNFLKECFRVLKPGGVLRVVTPDLVNLAEELIESLKTSSFEKAEWAQFEILDQCVRRKTGGLKKKWERASKENPELARYIFARSGRDFGKVIEMTQNAQHTLSYSISPNLRAHKTSRFVNLRAGLLRRYWAVIKLLIPKSIKEFNITDLAPGERHYWVYTFQQLQRMLVEIGFTDVYRVNAQETNSQVTEVIKMDVINLGQEVYPRKGFSSLYLEATKI
jgi:SAM-dependent methyltransferase